MNDRNIFEGMENVESSIDGTVIWGLDTQFHIQTVKKVLEICRINKVSLNKDKFQIAVRELTFLAVNNLLQP